MIFDLFIAGKKCLSGERIKIFSGIFPVLITDGTSRIGRVPYILLQGGENEEEL
jgi:hypothetical protein